MTLRAISAFGSPVALLAEGVDRNNTSRGRISRRYVALLAEGVDRNHLTFPAVTLFLKVALLAEGVDRNPPCPRYP